MNQLRATVRAREMAAAKADMIVVNFSSQPGCPAARMH
jgi:hypothetical protein